jgi:hypothetical protein
MDDLLKMPIFEYYMLVFTLKGYNERLKAEIEKKKPKNKNR